MLYGYVRVSTKEQNEGRQLIELEKYGVAKLNMKIDKSTGKNFNRPMYQELKDGLAQGDELAITSIDRLGRNKEQCLKELRELKEKGVIIRILEIPTTLTRGVDGENALLIDMMNNMLIEMYATFAEIEIKKNKKHLLII